MKHTFSALFATISVLSSAELLENPKECIDPNDYPADTDYFPDKFVPHETTDNIEITYHNTYKIITNKFQDKSYLLYQCGTEPPAEEVSSGKHHLVLPIPHAGGVAITETPQISPIELLGKRREITGYIGNPKYVSSPCMDYMMDTEKSIRNIYFPEDQYNQTLISDATDEYLLENPNTIIFVGPYGDADGDRRMAMAASQERTAVATFDWIGMHAARFNLEGMANQIVADVEARYDCSADNAALLTADIPQEEKPKVLWAQFFNGYGWSVASCPTWDAAYYCEFAHHCAADIISRPEGLGTSYSFGGDTLYWYLSDEQFLELGKDAELWVYGSKTFGDVYAEKKELLDQFVSVQNQNVFDTQGQGPHSWHEQRLAEYDSVAVDFCSLVGTSDPRSVNRKSWFRNYYTDAIGDVGFCDAPTEVDEPYVPDQAICTPITASGLASSGGNNMYAITSSASIDKRASLMSLGVIASAIVYF